MKKLYFLIVIIIITLPILSCNKAKDHKQEVLLIGLALNTGSTWSHQAYLKAPNNSNDDYFGSSVAISGDTIAVGAPGEASTTTSIINGSDLSSTNNAGNNNGAVYVFTRSGSTWSHQAYLKAPNNSNDD
ncbi:MAG TPA: FG-GAP repeat protein, partial [Spirochaetota bacterium]|nr:FG-GAP repeat protein [Spirochaetota bacterium]